MLGMKNESASERMAKTVIAAKTGGNP